MYQCFKVLFYYNILFCHANYYVCCVIVVLQVNKKDVVFKVINLIDIELLREMSR